MTSRGEVFSSTRFFMYRCFSISDRYRGFIVVYIQCAKLYNRMSFLGMGFQSTNFIFQHNSNVNKFINLIFHIRSYAPRKHLNKSLFLTNSTTFQTRSTRCIHKLGNKQSLVFYRMHFLLELHSLHTRQS